MQIVYITFSQDMLDDPINSGRTEETLFRFPASARTLSRLQSVQTDSPQSIGRLLYPQFLANTAGLNKLRHLLEEIPKGCWLNFQFTWTCSNYI
jgi:hypothetical protein